MEPAQRLPEVIDLLSDDEDEFFNNSVHEFDDANDLPAVQLGPFDFEENWERAYNADPYAQPDHQGLNIDEDSDIIDLTRPAHNDHFQREPVPAAYLAPINPASDTPIDANADLMEDELITAAACLQMILDILPDISVDHVLQLIADQTRDDTRTPEACQRIITQLLDGGAYPKEAEEEEVSRKRKRKRSFSGFEIDNGEERSQDYKNDAVDLLKDEFVCVPVRHIERVIKEQKTLFRAYGVIEEQLRNYSRLAPFTKINKARLKRGTELILNGRRSQIPKELQAAKKKCEEADTKRCKAEDALRVEESNLRKAVQAGEMGECQCCFDEFPLNRLIGCGGTTMHFFCRECVKNYVESEMGSSRCRPVCFADSTCGGSFTRKQLQDCVTATTFDRLEHMQQMQDLEIAGLDLDECPFCDFKQECPPVEEDKEFRCLNPKCRKTSCRLCQKETHIPQSCEEIKKDEKLSVRHIVEEAMTAALIRNCNKCKHPFIKEYGCNKMTCSHCGNQQCYVCSKDIKDYNHFSDYSRRAGCPLHDNIEDRHEQEVKKAADEAMAKAKAENSDVSDADLMIQVSDQVKEAEKRRLNRAQAAHRGFNYHMAGGVLRNGAAPADLLNPPNPAPVPDPAIPAAAPAAPIAPARQQYVPPVAQFQPLAAFVPHQHIFVHQPQVFQHQQVQFPPPVPLQLPPANPVPAQVPQVRVGPLQPLHRPHAQQQLGYRLANYAPLRLFQGLVGGPRVDQLQQPQPPQIPQAPPQIPLEVLPQFRPQVRPQARPQAQNPQQLDPAGRLRRHEFVLPHHHAHRQQHVVNDPHRAQRMVMAQRQQELHRRVRVINGNLQNPRGFSR